MIINQKQDKENKLKSEYAKNWFNSAEHFYENGDYIWASNLIKNYNIVLEVGCGSGHSTLALLESGHKVITIDNNKYCIDKAKDLIKNSGYAYSENIDEFNSKDVIFVNGDISENNIIENLMNVKFDIVICWNVGSYWSEGKLYYYKDKILNYGLTLEDIKKYPESSYSEYIQWKVCEIAYNNNSAVHIIDRDMLALDGLNDNYFIDLKKEFKYSKIKYENKVTSTKSSGGQILSLNNEICNSDTLDIYLISAIMSN